MGLFTEELSAGDRGPGPARPASGEDLARAALRPDPAVQRHGLGPGGLRARRGTRSPLTYEELRAMPTRHRRRRHALRHRLDDAGQHLGRRPVPHARSSARSRRPTRSGSSPTARWATPRTCRWRPWTRTTSWSRGATTARTSRPSTAGRSGSSCPKRYAWKSAKWLTGLEFTDKNTRGFWEVRGYHVHGEPFAEERYSYQEGSPGRVPAVGAPERQVDDGSGQVENDRVAVGDGAAGVWVLSDRRAPAPDPGTMNHETSSP